MHPLVQPSPFANKKPQIDPEFETSIDSYIASVLEEEKQTFQPGIVSFQMHATRLREQIRDSMIEFQQKFQKGYEVVANWLDAHKKPLPEIAKERLAILQDSESYLAKLNEGKYLFEILGFSEELMDNFYNAAHQLTQDGDFTKGRDAFFFLTTLAPDSADYWLGLAICTSQLKESDSALDATLRSIELNPTKADSYLNALYLYQEANDIDKARAICKQGIDYAQAKSQEPWSKELFTALEEAKEYINTHFRTGGYKNDFS